MERLDAILDLMAKMQHDHQELATRVVAEQERQSQLLERVITSIDALTATVTSEVREHGEIITSEVRQQTYRLVPACEVLDDDDPDAPPPAPAIEQAPTVTDHVFWQMMVTELSGDDPT